MDPKRKLENLLIWYKEAGIGYYFKLETKEKSRRTDKNLPAKAKLLEELELRIKNCKKCELHKTRTNFVFGEGNPEAKLMFVGEAPGEEEDKQGRPFVGPAGQLLTKLIESIIGLKREEVYIANVLKCRPPNNRNPQQEEILACQEHLFQQIEIIKPTIICTLGTYATSLLLGNEKFQISKIRGKLLTGRKGYKIFPTYHPSYLLRNPSQKRFAIEDFQTLSNLLKEIHETK